MATGGLPHCVGSAATPVGVEQWSCDLTQALLGVLARAHNRPFASIEQALLLRALMADQGLSQHDVARRCGRDVSWVSRRLQLLLGLPDAALAAVAGIFYSMRAQGIEPLMGVQPGLRAFTAAVVGGIGNLPGAALGGILLGLLETFAGGVPILSNYRDGISFAILILILLFKPAGLLGKVQVEKV